MGEILPLALGRARNMQGFDSALGPRGRARLAESLAETLFTLDLLARGQTHRQAEGKLAAFEHGDGPSDIVLEPLPFTEAIERFRELIPMTGAELTALGEEYRAYSFVVAEAADRQMTARVQDLISRSLAEGTGEREFIAAARDFLVDASRSQLSTIYQTNMSSAYMAGRWKGLREDPFVREALSVYRYVTMGDQLVRPTHRALEGFTASADDPAWREIWPPNGFNCRCDVIAVTEEEAARSGWRLSPRRPKDSEPDPGFDFNPGIRDEAVRDKLEARLD